ncbi:MAG TPA: ATPase, partial [Candidatus Jacksonbacteria bacterium]|nr:ATPase [Candidatus Jacksonbacteria bacterium]
QTLQESSLAGVRTIMMTGDHRLTAKAIGEELGMKVGSDQMIDGTQLDVMSTDELARAVKTVSIFARVTPDHKLNIVSALQSNGEVVAMTGDGVNDAPALKQADIGVALGSGTDVAKGVADIVILDNRFSTIVKTVKEGRIIFDNIRSVVLYLLTDSFSEVILIFLALLARVELPLIAVQILWINLVTDGFSDIALTLEPGDPDVMLDAPRKKDEPLVNREMKVLIGIVSSVSAVVAFATFLFVKAKTGDTDLARTVVFAMLGLDSLFYVFSLRSLRKPLWKLKFFTNGYLIASVIIAFFVQMAGIYVPVLQRVLQTTALDISHWLIVLIECVAIVVITEGVKGVFLKKERQKRTVPTSATVVVLAKG